MDLIDYLNFRGFNREEKEKFCSMYSGIDRKDLIFEYKEDGITLKGVGYNGGLRYMQCSINIE